MDNHTVLLCALGPVQELIASARRCHDLWYGSWLLSDLARCAASAIVDEAAKRGAAGDGLQALVFPGATGRAMLNASRESSVANRILARLPGRLEEAERIAVAARRVVDLRLDELARSAFDAVGRGDSERDELFERETAEAQVRDLLDVQWVAVAEGDGGYDEARRRAERLLAARKNTRAWSASSWGASVPKSSLDGVRESVLREELYDRRSPEDLYRYYGIHGSERLCGVGLLKRHGKLGGESAQAAAKRFFSTSHMAAVPWMLGAAQAPGAREAFEEYVSSLKESLGDIAQWLQVAPRGTEPFGRADGQLFFAGRLQEVAEEVGATDGSGNGGGGLAVRGAVRALSRFAKKSGVSPSGPLPYFGVLVADGDRMGRLIDGQPGFEAQRRLSRALVAFAKEARDVVEQHSGMMIYTGGDDALAFVPLHSALRCVVALSEAFKATLTPFATSDVDASLSVGLAVAHHLTPLDATLELARRAERLAKETRGSLAMIVDKRSGSEIQVAGPFTEDGRLPLPRRLQRLVEAHVQDLVPDKAAFELAALERLEGDEMGPVVAADVRRILSRKRAAHGAEPFDESLFDGLGPEEPGRLGRELIVARLLAEAVRQAGQQPGEEPVR